MMYGEGATQADPISAVPAPRRRSLVRTWHRYLSRNRQGLVEPVRSAVRGGSFQYFKTSPEVRKRRLHQRLYSSWRWHVDEVFVRISGELHYLWRAVDHEGEVLEAFVTKKRDRKAAVRFLKKAMKRYGRPNAVVTDGLPSYPAAMREIGNEACQETGRWLNNRAENSHQPFRRREGAMANFRDIKTLQKFVSVHAPISNHFNHDRHLNRRTIFKQNRTAALTEWRELCTA